MSAPDARSNSARSAPPRPGGQFWLFSADRRDGVKRRGGGGCFVGSMELDGENQFAADCRGGVILVQ